jgi:hypothetical protein
VCTVIVFQRARQWGDGKQIYPSVIARVVQMLRELGFDLQQAAHALKRTFLPTRVTFQCGEELGRVDHIYLGAVRRFGLRARFGEEEREAVQRSLYCRGTEIFEVLVIVVKDKEQRA